MYYKLKKDTYVRDFDEFGYIISVGIFNDQVFDKSGCVFIKALKREPKDLESLAEEIAGSFVDVSPGDIVEDIREFFDNLVEDGFVVRGETKEDCISRDKGFSYENVNEIIRSYEDYTPEHIRNDNSTQDVLGEYFLENPHLINFQIELTSKCNERCIHCYIPHKYKDTDIKPELYYSVLDQLEEMRVLHLSLSGGECLVHPRFKEFLRAAKERDFHVSVLSNLLLLDDEIIEIMGEGNKVDVQTSLYSMIPEHHDMVTTVKGSFEKTKDAILKLIDNDVPVQISCPTMNANKNDFLGVIQWAHQHKIRAYTDYAIMAQYDHDTKNLANRLSPEDVREVILDILKEDTDYQKQIMAEDFETHMTAINNDAEEPFCGVGISSCCMVANGNIYPCSGWQSYVCGNLYEESLKEIWLNSKKMNYLRNLRKKDIPQCLNCENRAFCSPCLSRFANESPTGNPLEIATHFCSIACINRETVLARRDRMMSKG